MQRARGRGDASGIVGDYHPSASLRPDSARAPEYTFVLPPGWRPSVGSGALSSDEAHHAHRRTNGATFG